MADTKITGLTERVASEVSDTAVIWFGMNDLSGTEASYKVSLATLRALVGVAAGTSTERAAVSGPIDNQLFFDTDLNQMMRWDSALSGSDKWVAAG